MLLWHDRLISEFCALLLYQGVSFALIAELAGASRAGAATGIMLGIDSAAVTLATPLSGHYIDRTGSYLHAWQTLTAAIAFAVLSFAVFLKELIFLS